MALEPAGDQLPVELAALALSLGARGERAWRGVAGRFPGSDSEGGAAGWERSIAQPYPHQLRMFTARATTSPIVTSDTIACAPISAFAVCVSGIVSVGLNAVALVSDTYR